MRKDRREEVVNAWYRERAKDRGALAVTKEGIYNAENEVEIHYVRDEGAAALAENEVEIHYVRDEEAD